MINALKIQSKILSLSLLWCGFSFGQCNQDYKVLNAILYKFSKEGSKELHLIENPYPFVNQSSFFTKNSFSEYYSGVLGVDSVALQKMIKTLDFEYLANQEKKIIKWDFSRLPKNIIKYSDEEKELNDMKCYCFSRPIYSKNKKIAFIYSFNPCGYKDSSLGTVLVYKKVSNKWVYSMAFPMP